MSDRPQPSTPQTVFATTRWTVVLDAAQTRAPGSKEALAELFRRYWKPLYGFARAAGHQPEQAQDAIQDFFLHLIEKRIIAHADRNRGRFRTFLLACLRNFLHSAFRRDNAQKRGREFLFIPLEADALIEAEQLQQGVGSDAEAAFDAQWALAIFERALARLRAEAQERKREHLFDELRSFLTTADTSSESYAEKAERLQVTVPMLKSAVGRLRERFRTFLREEVATTVEEPDEVDDEMRHLRDVLGRTLGRQEMP